MYKMANDENVSFFLLDNELEDIADNNEDIMEMMNEFNDVSTSQFYTEPEDFEKYTVNQLLKICEYYDLLKCVKMAKYKKAEIILAIFAFEEDIQNYEVVEKRIKVWRYMEELFADKKMRKYILWN